MPRVARASSLFHVQGEAKVRYDARVIPVCLVAKQDVLKGTKKYNEHRRALLLFQKTSAKEIGINLTTCMRKALLETTQQC